MRNQNKVIDISGQKFGELVPLEYLEGSHGYWICKCSCGNTIKIHRKYLINGTKTDCGHSKNSNDIHIGDIFGDWTIISGPISMQRGTHRNNYYKCKCSCGNEAVVAGYALRRGSSIKCKKHFHKNLTGKQFGDLTVIGYDGDNWICKCRCGSVDSYNKVYLRNGEIKRCTKCRKQNRLTDLTGKQFGELTVLYYNSNKTWACKCSCGSIKNIRSANLINGSSTSCGHKYVTAAANRSIQIRSKEQIEALYSREKLLAYTKNIETIEDFESKLGVKRHTALRLIHKYSLDIHIDRYSSLKEKEVANFIKSLYYGNIQTNVRNIISPLELDIYIPEKKIAIEFNGNYWHSDINKDKNYHQEKTLNCAKHGIRLIHIFEYEWNSNEDKIKQYLSNMLLNKKAVYARETKVKEVDKKEAYEFLDKYHIQGRGNAEINLGIISNNELISVMSFGKPRFNKNYQYELIRYASKCGITVVGGAEKLFKYFINNYEVDNIISYAEISKFTGNIYLKLGFKLKTISEPNYVWISFDENNVLSRYQTQKHILIEKGLGTEDQTEYEIMTNNEYYRVFDSGNLVLTYSK